MPNIEPLSERTRHQSVIASRDIHVVIKHPKSTGEVLYARKTRNQTMAVSSLQQMMSVTLMTWSGVLSLRPEEHCRTISQIGVNLTSSYL